MSSTPADRPPLGTLLLIATVCVIVAAWVRASHSNWVAPLEPYVEAGYAQADALTSFEPDGLYHMRRVARALEEGSIAGTDPLLNYPDGAAIPWPPYADRASLALSRLTAPEEAPARAAFLERRLSQLPFLYGLASCALLCVAAGSLFRSRAAAMVTGLSYALCYGAVHYQVPGIADHHAWVSLLNFAALVICARAWRFSHLCDARRSAHQGVAAGVLMGLSLGSWVASLLWLGALQLALGLLWVQAGRTGRYQQLAGGLRAFGLSFHAAALLLLLPAALASPWRETHPWMVVNLSWFHPVELLLGLAVFLPRRTGRFPALAVPAAIGVVAALLLALNLGPGAGMREGFAWVSRADEFMSGIAESNRLSWKYLGWTGLGVFLLPFIILGWKDRTVRRGRPEFAALGMVLLLAWLQAITQIRFVEAMMGPAALAYGWLVAGVLRRGMVWLPQRAAAWRARPAAMRLAITFVVALVSSLSLVGIQAASAITAGGGAARLDDAPAARRHLLEWIGARSSSPSLTEAEGSVLAPWDWGHEIEWRTGLASVATNFGSYVGVEGYRAPARFFLATDPAQAKAILDRHQVRYVVRSSRLTLAMEQLQRSYGEGLPEGGFVEQFEDAQGRERLRFQPAWFDTMAAALGVGVLPRPDGGFPGLGDPDGPQLPSTGTGQRAPLDFLRLVHVSPIPDAHPQHGGLVQPFGLIWEHVQGAQVSIAAESGQELRVELGIQVGFAGEEVISA